MESKQETFTVFFSTTSCSVWGLGDPHPLHPAGAPHNHRLGSHPLRRSGRRGAIPHQPAGQLVDGDGQAVKVTLALPDGVPRGRAGPGRAARGARLPRSTAAAELVVSSRNGEAREAAHRRGAWRGSSRGGSAAWGTGRGSTRAERALFVAVAIGAMCTLKENYWEKNKIKSCYKMFFYSPN